MQNLAVVTYDGSSDDFSSQFLVRRSRIKLDGFIFSPKITYKVELGLSNRDLSVNNEDGNTRDAARVILDAVIKWKFSKHWSLWFGQTKLPGNRERMISSGDLQFVDRSLLNSRFTLDRDAGFQLKGDYQLGKTLVIPTFSLSQGEGRNITSLNAGGYDYTMRLEVLPLGAFSNKKGAYISSDLDREPTPKLSLAIAYDYNDGAVRQGGQLGKFVEDRKGTYVENSLSTVFADLIFKYRGFSVLSEYASKRSSAAISDLANQFRTGQGFTIQAGYLNSKNVEVALRHTRVDRDIDLSSLKNERQMTLALSKYVVGHKLKVQSDLTWINVPDASSDRYQWRLQLEMQF